MDIIETKRVCAESLISLSDRSTGSQYPPQCMALLRGRKFEECQQYCRIKSYRIYNVDDVRRYFCETIVLDATLHFEKSLVAGLDDNKLMLIELLEEIKEIVLDNGLKKINKILKKKSIRSIINAALTRHSESSEETKEKSLAFVIKRLTQAIEAMYKNDSFRGKGEIDVEELFKLLYRVCVSYPVYISGEHVLLLVFLLSQKMVQKAGRAAEQDTACIKLPATCRQTSNLDPELQR